MIIVKNGQITLSGVGYRLIHNGLKTVALIEGTELTYTSTSDIYHQVEELITEQQALDRIEELNLSYTLQADCRL